MYKLAVFPNILAFQEGSLLLCLSKPSSLVRYGFSLHHTSSSSTHICISLELFMLCFVFNTPSCKKARLPGIKQSKTPLPLKPVPPWLENLWPSHRPWDRSEEEAAWNSAPSCFWCTGSFCHPLDILYTVGKVPLTVPVPQHLPGHLKLPVSSQLPLQ